MGVTIYNKLNFATHLVNITKNAKSKFNGHVRVQKYMITDQNPSYFLLLLNLTFLLFINMVVWHKTFCWWNKQRTRKMATSYTKNYTSDFKILL